MKIALIYLLLGVLSGLIYNLLKGIVFVCKQHIISQIICDIIFCLCIGTIFGLATNRFFYGEWKLYLCIIFAIGILVEQKTLGKIFAKVFLILYNWIIKGLTKFSSTKVGKIITK